MKYHRHFSPALIAAGLIVTAGSALAARPVQTPQHTAMAPASNHSAAADALRGAMRKLWSDHVIWTRDYIVAAVDGRPDQKAAAARLLKNQEDIGAAVAGYYGKAAGDRLTELLKEHIMIAVDLIQAAKAGDKAKYAATDDRWQQNGDAIATFLSSANPNWPKATLADMMKTHLSTTTAEVVARLGGKWDEDVAAFDAVYTHILMMSDALTDGIIKQFPAKFRQDAAAISSRRRS